MIKNNLQSPTSRRKFLKGAAMAVVAPAIARAWSQEPRPAPGPLLAYVGTYTGPGAPGGPAHGRGIYLFAMDPATGALAERALFPNAANPSWLDLDPSRTHLYCSNEIDNYRDEKSGSINAYAIDRRSGHLTLLNTVPSEGSIPAFVSVHPSGKYLLVANYGSGTVAAIALRPNGELGRATSVQQDRGPHNAKHATSSPPGNFALGGHDAPRAHMIQADPSGRFVLSADLGLDRIMIWKFDLASGKLSPSDPPFVSLPLGDGPRHFVFHPNGRWFYSLQEEGSTVTFFHYNGERGTLSPQQKISTLPKEFAGTNMCSEIRVSADGRFIYAANRLHDSIAAFAVGREGRLTYLGESWTRGDTPRSITLDPTGRFLFSLNQLGDAITAFRINHRTGRLNFTGLYTPVGTPACMVFWR